MNREAIGAVDPSREPTPRYFGISHWMLLIGVVACLIAFPRLQILRLIQQLSGLGDTIAVYCGFGPPKRYGPHQHLMKSMRIYGEGVLWYIVQVSQQLIVSVAPVLLIMRLIRPRPPIRRLLTQPGVIASLAVLVGSILVTGWLHYFFFGRIIDGTVMPIAAGGTVALAWTCLALGKRWDAEPGWIDRFGRLLGITAISVGLLALLKFGI